MSAPIIPPVEAKPEVIVLEDIKMDDDIKKVIDREDIPVSPLKDLPRRKALWVYRKAVLIAVLIAWSAIMDGYLVSIPGSIVANKFFVRQFCTVRTEKGCALDSVYVGAWTAVQSVGQIIGMLAGPLTADRFGRKFNLALLTVILTIGVICEIVARTPAVWLVARLFAGWGTGMVQTGVPVYISEIAPHQVRGAMIATYNFWFGIGGFAAAIGLEIVVNHTGYMGVVLSQWVFVGVMVIVWFVVPESPWYWLNRENPEKTKQVLQKIYGGIPGYDVDLEFRVLNYERELQIRQASEQANASYMELFRGSNLRRTIISWLPLQMQGLGGLSFVLSYTTYFFQLAGVKEPFLGNVIVNCIKLGAQMVSWYNIERFGRRILLLVGCGGMVIGCLLIAAVGTNPNWTPPGGLTITLFCLWTAAYSSSAAPIGYVYLAEIATPRLRSKTAGFAAACTACFGVFTNFVTPILLSPQKAGWSFKTGYLFFGLGAAGWVATFFLVPEVAGRTYEEIDELFENKVPTRKFASTKTRVQLANEQEVADGA